MRKRRMTTDLDGVLGDMVSELLLWHNDAYGTSMKHDDVVSHDLWEVWGGTEEDMLGKFDKFYKTQYFRDIRPVAGARGALTKLNNAYDIFVVTARPTHVAEETQRWLRKNFGSSFKEVYFTDYFSGWTKSSICADLSSELMIEDAPAMAIECAIDRKVLLYDRPWNRQCSAKGIERVQSWDDIAKKLVS